MVYNTALGLLLCGGSLVAVSAGRDRVSAIGGLYATAVGFLTLGEHILEVDFGIDQLLMTHYVAIATPIPGGWRSTPQRALCWSGWPCCF